MNSYKERQAQQAIVNLAAHEALEKIYANMTPEETEAREVYFEQEEMMDEQFEQDYFDD